MIRCLTVTLNTLSLSSSLFYSPFFVIIRCACASVHYSFKSQPCHASTHSRAISLPLSDISQSSSSPCVLLLDGSCKPLSSENFQLSHFFRVHGADFSPLHQIFIEGAMGEAGSPRALLSSTHLTSIPLFSFPLNLPLLSVSLSFPLPRHHLSIVSTAGSEFLLSIGCSYRKRDAKTGTDRNRKRHRE